VYPQLLPPEWALIALTAAVRLQLDEVLRVNVPALAGAAVKALSAPAAETSKAVDILPRRFRPPSGGEDPCWWMGNRTTPAPLKLIIGPPSSTDHALEEAATGA
jgi:hypothetical protein